MKDANRNDQGRSAQQSYPKENTRNRGAEQRAGQMNIPGGAGAAGQIPIKGNDAKLEDDPLRNDVDADIDDQMADELDSALDEAKARGEIREMPGIAELERKHESKP